MSSKRAAESEAVAAGNSDDSDSDNDFGPMPATEAAVESSTSAVKAKRKKLRKLEHEQLYLRNIPTAKLYEHSFMHRDVVTHIVVSKPTEFVITASLDGHVKFWKKMADNIEFVKHFQAHISPITAFELSPDGRKLLSVGKDRMLKFFEVQSFDISSMLSIEFSPSVACWLPSSLRIATQVAVADENSGSIFVFSSELGGSSLAEIKIHSAPVRTIFAAPAFNTVISTDSKGLIEYWDAESYDLPASPVITFKFKSETDLYDLAKSKTWVVNGTIAPSGDVFALVSRDKQIRIFDFKTGKLRCKFDESARAYQLGAASRGDINDAEMVVRLASETELEGLDEAMLLHKPAFDETGNFLVFASLVGIKVFNVVTNKVVRVVGGLESTERFLCVALYQGTPQVDTQYLLSKAGSDSGSKTADQLHADKVPDPTFFCTSFKRRRFYSISTREPGSTMETRDVFNEMPTEDERALGQELAKAKSLGSTAIIRTSVGEITIKLFPDECPKTVENFVTHCRNGYYNNHMFHRVIKGFMIQTGDPTGTGAGGESIWGHEFEDEFVRTLRHDRPFTVSMANAGPNTNGSQFFITTVPTPWLDNKHTVFGRVTKGFEAVTKIENLKVNKSDKPIEGDVKIQSIAIL